MAQLTIVFWRDIPAQVTAKAGRTKAARHLGETYEKAIDRAAMRAKLRDSDQYLAEWRRSDPVECSDDLEAEVEALAGKLRLEYDETRLKALVENGGLESGK